MRSIQTCLKMVFTVIICFWTKLVSGYESKKAVQVKTGGQAFAGKCAMNGKTTWNNHVEENGFCGNMTDLKKYHKDDNLFKYRRRKTDSGCRICGASGQGPPIPVPFFKVRESPHNDVGSQIK